MRQSAGTHLIVRLTDGEPPHQHAADAIGALGVFVLPGQRIARGRGQHVHVVALADLLGEQPAACSGPAVISAP